MAEPKTQPTGASVSAYINALADERKRDDCRHLVQMMTRVTGAPPVLWGTSIVGFDAYRTTYASSTGGDWPVIGFAARARDITLYLMDGFEQRADALARLGRHTHSKSCLHVKSLAGIDLGVLEAMLADSVRVMRARHPTSAAATDRVATQATRQPARTPTRAVKAATGEAASEKTATKKTATKLAATQAAKKAATQAATQAANKSSSKAASPKRSTQRAAGKPSTTLATRPPAPAGRKRARSP